MELPDGRMVVSEGGLDALRRTQRILAGRDIASEIVSPPKKFCSSCGTKLWLAVASPDMKSALAVMEAEYLDGLDETARKCATAVVDVTLSTRQCPACMAEYAAGPVKCPECGLFIGA